MLAVMQHMKTTEIAQVVEQYSVDPSFHIHDATV